MLCNRFLFVMTLACASVLGSSSSHASDDGVGGTLDPVPVELTSEPESTGYIQPTCSKCQDLEVEREEDSTGETRGVLELTYFDDVYTEFEGSIEVTVLLHDATEDVVLIEHVWLTEGDAAQWIIDAPQDWSWEEVDRVRLVLVPAE